MEWLLSIVLFVIAWCLLICLHELGHFSMAKLFNVYCHEFSIGFGPALIHKRKKGKETYFSLRAIPLGGYVSMFGEEDQQFEEGLTLPPERSIEGIKKWKKAIVVSAGIIVNAILALVFFSVRNFCFPYYGATREFVVNEGSLAYLSGLRSDDKIQYISETSEKLNYSYEYRDDDGVIHADSFYIVDNEVDLNGYKYVATFSYYTNKDNNDFAKGISLYVAATKDDVNNDDVLKSLYSTWANSDGAPDYYPNVKRPYDMAADITFDINIDVLRDEQVVNLSLNLSATKTEGMKSIGAALRIKEFEVSTQEKFENVFEDFGSSATAVFRGLGILFSKGGVKNMSGVVGIFTTSKELLVSQTFASYLEFWGLISVNLAIFNLLPFPGLDGWQLLVTTIEGISRKKISTKFKTIMSLLGFALLIILMIVILAVDIGRLI